jgi:copper homeostasis protein CutC
VRPAALHHRVEKLEAAARQGTTPSTGATIAAILEGREPRAPIPDEVLARTRVGTVRVTAPGLLLARQRRWAEVGHQG